VRSLLEAGPLPKQPNTQGLGLGNIERIYVMQYMLLPGALLVFCAAPAYAAPPEAEGVDLIARQTEAGEIVGWKSFHETAGVTTADVWQLGADGILVCKGQPRGYLYTEKDYTDVTMTLQWRWPPEGKPGNGGLLLRTTGENKIWPKSLEVQFNSGQAGDYWGLCGYPLTGPADRMKTLDHDIFGRLTNVKHCEAREKPAGQWNTCEVVLKGGKVSVKINGKRVNEAEGCEVAPGKIVLTAEGNEIHFRNVRLLRGK